MAKTVPLSVRIPHEDAEFLAGLKIDKATTPSDKVRAIISAHKKQSLVEGKPSYGEALNWVDDVLAPISLSLREIQNQENTYSELIRSVAEWLPDFLACYLNEGRAAKNIETMEQFEADLCDKLFRFIESVLRMGVIEEAPCIDRNAISKRIGTSVQLVEVIQHRLTQQRGV